MFSSQSVEISLGMPLRSMDAVQGDKTESRFLVGTSCITDSNNCLQLLRFHSDLNQWMVEAILQHPLPGSGGAGGGGIETIATHPTDSTKVLTLTEQSSQSTLWKIPTEIMEKTSSSMGYLGDEDVDDLPPAETATLEELCVLKHTDDPTNTTTTMVDVQWKRTSHMSTGGDDDYDGWSSMQEVMTLDRRGRLTQWNVGVGTATSQCHLDVDVTGSAWNLPPRMSWDPHHADCAAIAIGTQIQTIDWRSSMSSLSSPCSSGGSISGGERFPCHRYGVTDLDYNPNKPHVLVTSGQEGLLKFWDLRNSRQPLLTVSGGHSHWVTKVSYNPFHDQLVTSAGTDSIVNLWRISSISSAPLLTLDDDNDEDPLAMVGGEEMQGGGGTTTTTSANKSSNPNVRVSRLEHMDSVYATAWGAADAWIYASAGYDGKVVLSHVPSKEKYKILL